MKPLSKIVNDKVEEINTNENIKVFTDSEVEETIGFFGNFEVKVKRTGGEDDNVFPTAALACDTESWIFFAPWEHPTIKTPGFDETTEESSGFSSWKNPYSSRVNPRVLASLEASGEGSIAGARITISTGRMLFLPIPLLYLTAISFPCLETSTLLARIISTFVSFIFS